MNKQSAQELLLSSARVLEMAEAHLAENHCERDAGRAALRLSHSCAFGYDHRDVVCLFVRTELMDLVRDC